jgi:transcriptional regulator with XRE-family HTH domain
LELKYFKYLLCPRIAKLAILFLKAGRRQVGLTQLEAAKRLGTSQPYLSQLEKGLRSVTPELAERATKVYGLPPDSLARTEYGKLEQ